VPWSCLFTPTSATLRYFFRQGSISSTFYSRFLYKKCFFCQNVTREKLRKLSCKALLYKKRVHKTFMKLTPCVKFTNVSRTAFMLVDPKSVKNTVKSSVSFYAFGICMVKAVRRTLMRLSPGWKFTKLLKQICKIFCNFKVLLLSSY